MARSLNIVIGADIDKLREGLANAVTALQQSGAKMTAETAKSAKSIQDKLAEISTKNPTAGTVRQLTNLAMQTRALGPEFAGMANQIIREAGKIKDSIGDARAEVEYFASDTRRLDAVLGGVNAVAGAFGAVEGALALTGFQSEDLQKTMVKLQGAIALVNGITVIQTALQKESAVMQGILAAATEVQKFVMVQATVAARAYAAALVATGAGAVVVAIGLVISLFQGASRATEEAKEKLAELQAQQEKTMTKGQRRIKEEEKALELAISIAEKEGKTEGEILQIKKESLDKQKAIYKEYSEEAQMLLHQQHIARVSLTKKGSKEEKAAYKQYEEELNDLRYAINQEYQNKVIALEIENNKIIQKENEKAAEDKKKTTKKQNEDEIKALQDHHAGLMAAEEQFIKLNKIREEKRKTDIQKSKELTGANLIAGTAIAPILIQVKIDPKSYSQVVQDFDKLMTDMAAAIERLAEDIAITLGETLGNALSGQGNVLANFGNAVIITLAQFLSQIGKMLVAYAISIEKLRTAFARPEEALVAGIALVALGTLITNKMKQGPNVAAFAEGGIVSGPTLGLMGEYPNARTNPEIIAPLDKLRGMLRTNETNGYIASTQIQGRDLALVLERYNKDSKRG